MIEPFIIYIEKCVCKYVRTTNSYPIFNRPWRRENNKENVFARSHNDRVLSVLHLGLIMTSRSRFVSRKLTRVNSPSLHNEAHYWSEALWRKRFQKESKESYYRDICNTIAHNARLTYTYIYALFTCWWNLFNNIYKYHSKLLLIVYLILICFRINALLLSFHQQRTTIY